MLIDHLRTRAGGQAAPIGNGRVDVGADRVPGIALGGADVGFGRPVQVPEIGRGPEPRRSFRSGAIGNTSPANRTSLGPGEVGPADPDRVRPGGPGSTEPSTRPSTARSARNAAQLAPGPCRSIRRSGPAWPRLWHEAYRSKIDRSKVKRGVRRAKRSVGADPEGGFAPVEEGEGITVRQHHPLGLSRSSPTYKGYTPGRCRRSPVGRGEGASSAMQLDPNGQPRSGMVRTGPSPTTTNRGIGPLTRASRPGARRRCSAATTTALTPASARIPAPRARSGEPGSTGT